MSNLAILQQPVHIDNIIDVLPNYVFWKDSQYRYLGCNDNFARLIGKENKEEVVGCTDHNLGWGRSKSGCIAADFQRDDAAVMDGNNITNKRETLSVNGTIITTLVSKRAIIDDNNVVGVVGCFSDISELTEAQRKAEAASKAKSEFITNMSYNLRTPMVGVSGMLDCLMCAADSAKKATTSHTEVLRDLIAKIREYATIAQDSSNELVKFFSDILDVVQLDVSNCTETKLFDVRLLLQRSIDLLRPIATNKKLALSLTVADNVPQYLHGLSHYLNRILTNLISNALTFTKEGSVNISADIVNNQRDADKPTDTVCVRICVSDTGIGIPKDKFAEIFGCFSRLTSPYQRVCKGAGLGLHTVKQYVKAMGGDVKVESELGKGSIFTVHVHCRAGSLEYKEQKIEKNTISTNNINRR